MTGHRVLLAALLVKLHLPACALWPKILDLHAQRCGDAGKGIGEGGDERAVAQVAQGFGRNALDERAPLLALEHRRLAGLHDVLRSAHGRGRIQRNDLAGDQPIEQHPHGGELLLHVRRRMRLLAGFDVARHVDGPNRRQR